MAGKQFSEAYDSGLSPMEFVNKMRKDGQLIMGIGHRVKSVSENTTTTKKKYKVKSKIFIKYLLN